MTNKEANEQISQYDYPAKLQAFGIAVVHVYQVNINDWLKNQFYFDNLKLVQLLLPHIDSGDVLQYEKQIRWIQKHFAKLDNETIPLPSDFDSN